MFNTKNKMFPKFPPGKNTDNEKKPFQIVRKISREVNPQTGQIAIRSEIIETSPTTAPTGINFGLYSSTDVTPMKLGKMKEV